MYYKDTQNKLHEIDIEFAYLLPVGSIQITNEEAEAIRLASVTTQIPTTAAPQPTEVTMRQARLALAEAGLLSTIETAINNMPGIAGVNAKIEWEYSSTMRRTQPLVLSLGTQLGLSETDLDNLFLSASQK